jgi:hypothetical protein
MKDIKAVTVNLKAEIVMQQLPDYLAGKLTDEEQWNLEEQMNNDIAFSDAIEGLKSIENPAEIAPIQQIINQAIITRISKKKKSKFTAPLFYPTWIFLLTAVLLIIAIAVFIVILLLK